MFITPLGLLVILIIHVMIGTTISLVVILPLLRKRTTGPVIGVGAIVATAVWFLALHLSDKAGVSGYSRNGSWEMLPWRVNTPWQNFLGGHPYLIGITSAAFATFVFVLIVKNWQKLHHHSTTLA